MHAASGAPCVLAVAGVSDGDTARSTTWWPTRKQRHTAFPADSVEVDALAVHEAEAGQVAEAWLTSVAPRFA